MTLRTPSFCNQAQSWGSTQVIATVLIKIMATMLRGQCSSTLLYLALLFHAVVALPHPPESISRAFYFLAAGVVNLLVSLVPCIYFP